MPAKRLPLTWRFDLRIRPFVADHGTPEPGVWPG